MNRCLVLNANYEYLAVLDRWIDALALVFAQKVEPLAHYPLVVRSEKQAFPVPAVVMMRHLVHTRRRRALFDVPAKAIVLARDGFTCQYCGARITLRTGTRDHVQPRSRGGRDVLANVVAACSPCNLRKMDRTPAEAGMHLRSQPRPLVEEEKLACLLRTVRSEERTAWLSCLRRHGITLWTARAA
ncbi:MAG: HNH endonuclease [Planctomycetes bacterium]|nr:HNH endonuclease [Planctomycetota bacterium]